MSNKLKQITTKAKALYKTGLFSKWTDAIKAASKQIGKTKKVGYAGRRYKIEKEITKEIKSAPKELFPFTKNQQLIKAGKKVFDKKYKELHDNKNINGMKKKKAAPKKKSSYHKDTKSHNVNIKVVSGSPRLHFINKEKDIILKITALIKYNKEIEDFLIHAKNKIKNDKSEFFVKNEKKQLQNFVKRYAQLLKSNKKYLSELKKGIK